MQTTLKMICTLGGTAALVGCASNSNTPETIVVPAMKVRHSHESADAYYTLGRYHHGGRRFDEAAKAYQRALDLDAGHIKARNAMGILHAERGEYEQAIHLLREAADAAPENSQLFSNLGYAYYLKGDYDHAAAALEIATTLDPKNVRAWNNLGSVMGKLGKTDRARLIFARVNSLRAEGTQDENGGKALPPLSIASGNPDVTRMNQVASESLEEKSVAINDSLQSNRPHSEYRTEIKQVTPGVYEVRQVLATSPRNEVLPGAASANVPQTVPFSKPVPGSGVASAVPHSVVSQSSPSRYELADIRATLATRPVRIEISNGNGINGMAKSVGEIIGSPVLKVVKLTNQAQFNVKATRVEYGEGYEQAARALANNLGHSVDAKYNKNGFGTNIRIVLGRDLTDTKMIQTRFSDQFRLTQKEDDKRG